MYPFIHSIVIYIHRKKHVFHGLSSISAAVSLHTRNFAWLKPSNFKAICSTSFIVFVILVQVDSTTFLYFTYWLNFMCYFAIMNAMSNFLFVCSSEVVCMQCLGDGKIAACFSNSIALESISEGAFSLKLNAHRFFESSM